MLYQKDQAKENELKTCFGFSRIQVNKGNNVLSCCYDCVRRKRTLWEFIFFPEH